jgi:hypothetical protein
MVGYSCSNRVAFEVLVGSRGIGSGLLSNVAVSAASGVSGLRQLFGMASDPDGLTHDDLRRKTH